MSLPVPPLDGAQAAPSLWKLVLVPVVVSWLVVLFRLYAELNLVDDPPTALQERLYSPQGGGGGALIGITWLVLVFGLWFGLRLARSGCGPASPWRAVLTHVVAIAVAMGAGFGLHATGMVKFETGNLSAVVAVWSCAVGGAVIAATGWPQLARALLAYGFLSRLMVVAVTFPAVLIPWKTHFSRGPDGDVPAEWYSALVLSGFQIFLWVPFTILAGGLCGSLVALVARRP